jgi:hypothetical protein
METLTLATPEGRLIIFLAAVNLAWMFGYFLYLAEIRRHRRTVRELEDDLDRARVEADASRVARGELLADIARRKQAVEWARGREAKLRARLNGLSHKVARLELALTEKQVVFGIRSLIAVREELAGPLAGFDLMLSKHPEVRLAAVGHCDRAVRVIADSLPAALDAEYRDRRVSRVENPKEVRP